MHCLHLKSQWADVSLGTFNELAPDKYALELQTEQILQQKYWHLDDHEQQRRFTVGGGWVSGRHFCCFTTSESKLHEGQIVISSRDVSTK